MSVLSRSLLEALLAPLSARSFCADVWDRRSLVIRGEPDRFERLFGVSFDERCFFRTSAALARQEAKIGQLNAERGLDIGVLWRATFDQTAFLGKRGANPFVQIRPEQVKPIYAGGASIQLAGIESLVFGDEQEARIARACERLRSELSYPGVVLVGATLSPPGAGFGPHFDPTGAFLLQTAGRKRYAFSANPIVPWPRGKAYVLDDGTLRYRTAHQGATQDWERPERLPEPLLDQSVELGPGDALYLPPGAAHATVAGAEGASTSLLVIFGQASPRMLLMVLIEELLGSNEAWRRLPAFVDSNATGALPADVARFVDERLSQVRALLGSMRGDSFEVARIWRKLTAQSVPPPARRAVDRRPIVEDDVLVVVRDAPLELAAGRDAADRKMASLFRGQTEVAVDGAWADWLCELARRDRFVAREALTWSADLRATWAEVAACLQDLLDRGFLERPAE